MKPRARGLSTLAFARLRSELPILAERLSDDQLLELADSMHDLLRGRRERRPEGRVTFVYAGLNDNKPLTRRPFGRSF